MRVMVIVKANKDSEAGVLPRQELLAEMGKYNEDLVKAGVMLEHFHLLCSVSGAKKEAFAIGGGNRVKGVLSRPQQFVFGARSVSAQDLLDLAPHRFDRVEVRRIGRQIEQPGTGGFDGLAHAPDFMRAQVVQDHHIAGP